MGSIFWAGSEKPGKLFPSLQRILCRSESVWYLAACLYPDMGCWIAYWRTQSRLVVHNQLFQITTSFSVLAKIYFFWGIKMALESCKKNLKFVWTWIFTKYVPYFFEIAKCQDCSGFTHLGLINFETFKNWKNLKISWFILNSEKLDMKYWLIWGKKTRRLADHIPLKAKS